MQISPYGADCHHPILSGVRIGQIVFSDFPLAHTTGWGPVVRTGPRPSAF